jgi:hypothetical protein
VLDIRFMKIRPDRVEKLRAWMNELNNRKDEALATLEQETVWSECGYLIEAAEGPVLVYVMEAEDLTVAKAIVNENPHPIDLEHRAVMRDVLDGPAQFEQVLNLSR